MHPSQEFGVGCPGDDCWNGYGNAVLAEAMGWIQVGDKLYCPDHGPLAALQERRAAEKQAQRAHHNQKVAKKMLSPAEYRAWDEFQADLANFHREHGRLAHKELRTMNPGKWVQTYRQLGRIDIALSTQGLEEADQERLQRITDRMR